MSVSTSLSVAPSAWPPGQDGNAQTVAASEDAGTVGERNRPPADASRGAKHRDMPLQHVVESRCGARRRGARLKNM